MWVAYSGVMSCHAYIWSGIGSRRGGWSLSGCKAVVNQSPEPGGLDYCSMWAIRSLSRSRSRKQEEKQKENRKEKQKAESRSRSRSRRLKGLGRAQSWSLLFGPSMNGLPTTLQVDSGCSGGRSRGGQRWGGRAPPRDRYPTLWPSHPHTAAGPAAADEDEQPRLLNNTEATSSCQLPKNFCWLGETEWSPSTPCACFPRPATHSSIRAV